LRWEGVYGRAVDRSMLESDWTVRGEVLAPELREELVVVANEKLSWIQTPVVVPPGVEN
jgi:hypothetical protein